jgi:hypothetical protein
MKKDKFLILGMLAIVLTLALGFAGCDTDGSDEPYDVPESCYG